MNIIYSLYNIQYTYILYNIHVYTIIFYTIRPYNTVHIIFDKKIFIYKKIISKWYYLPTLFIHVSCSEFSQDNNKKKKGKRKKKPKTHFLILKLMNRKEKKIP